MAISAVGYADDILLMSESPELMNKLLKICEEYGHTHDIKWNPKKTTALIVGVTKISSKSRRPLALTLCGQSIERVASFKYLGYEIEEKCRQSPQVAKNIMKAAGSLFALRLAGIFNKWMAPQTKSFLYKTYCRPVLFYGLEIGTLLVGEAKKLQRAENMMVKMFLHLPSRTKATEINYAIELEPVTNALTVARANFLKRISTNSIVRSLLITALIDQKKANNKIHRYVDEIREMIGPTCHRPMEPAGMLAEITRSSLLLASDLKLANETAREQENVKRIRKLLGDGSWKNPQQLSDDTIEFMEMIRAFDHTKLLDRCIKETTRRSGIKALSISESESDPNLNETFSD